jgi:hypothetical protein
MKNTASVILSGIAIALAIVSIVPCSAQTPEGCYSSNNVPKSCGSDWDDGDYHCICDCSTIPPARCTKKSSSGYSSGGGGGGGGGYSPQVQMMQSILTPVFNNFFNWLFSSPSNDKQQQAGNREVDKKWEEEYNKRQEEFKAKTMEQLNNARSEYQKQQQDHYQVLKDQTISEFKNRFAVSEAIKAVKQANCDAYNSLQDAQSTLENFKDLDGPLEKARKTADFTSANSTGCPPIVIKIPEVSANHPISFQQQFYGYIVRQSDSIKQTLESLKEKKAANDKVLEELKRKAEGAKPEGPKPEEPKPVVDNQQQEKKPDSTGKQQDDDPLLAAAMKARETSVDLQAATEESKKINEEIAASEKSILALDKMRKMYDAPQTPAQPSPK